MSCGSLFNRTTEPMGHSMDTSKGIWQSGCHCQAVACNFTFPSGIEYDSTQDVLTSQSPFSITTWPMGHSMNASSVIQHSPYAIMVLQDLILILQVELNITALSMF